MHPPASSAATEKSCNIDKVRFFRTNVHICIPSLQVPAAESLVKSAEAKKSANKRSSCNVSN